MICPLVTFSRGTWWHHVLFHFGIPDRIQAFESLRHSFREKANEMRTRICLAWFPNVTFLLLISFILYSVFPGCFRNDKDKISRKGEIHGRFEWSNGCETNMTECEIELYLDTSWPKLKCNVKCVMHLKNFYQISFKLQASKIEMSAFCKSNFVSDVTGASVR